LARDRYRVSKSYTDCAVINADYIEPRQFLEDTGCVVLERVRDVIERHNSVKVNTVFNGEFVTGDKRAKYKHQYEKL